MFIHSGTALTPRHIDSEEEVYEHILAKVSPPMVAPPLVDDVVKIILRLYPNTPALGSPFGTGDETFGLSSVYKQTAAIR